MDEDFLWFDDTLYPVDEQALESKNKLDSYIKVDLIENPDILLEFVSRSPACRGYVVDVFKRSYMLHIWTWPRFSVEWRRKADGPNKSFFAVRRF